MNEHTTTHRTAAEPAQPAAYLAQFATVDELLSAAEELRDAGYRRWDCHSPYPVHGIERAMGMRHTILPWLVLGAGVAGAAVALAMQWWMNAVDYPMLISGKPLFSLPASIPVAFELIVLFAALTAFGGAIVLNRLPQLAHPLLRNHRFRQVTTDGLFLSVDASDAKFDLRATRELLESCRAVAVELCYQPAAGKLPSLLVLGAWVLVLLALLPPLLIARARSIPSAQPRLHVIQDMDNQPRYKAQAASPFFSDGRAMRPVIAGTIAAGELEADDHLYRGKKDGQWAATFPVPVNQATIRRGQERFNVYCAACHGLTGAGDGMVSQRAFKRGDVNWARPVPLTAESVRTQPAGQLFHTITHGVRKMPSYAAQIPVADRWAIVLYLRALQRSQNATLDDVPEALRTQLR